MASVTIGNELINGRYIVKVGQVYSLNTGHGFAFRVALQGGVEITPRYATEAEANESWDAVVAAIT